MKEADLEREVEPLCPVFGQCGGCSYQHVTYDSELQAKETLLREILAEKAELAGDCFEPIVASPETYHTRSRLDLTIRRIRSGEIFMGFMPPGKKTVISIDACPIARNAISDYIPRLRKEASERLPAKYRNANLVIKTGDDGRVAWGGIGRRSLRMHPEDYFWTEVRERRIYYSLETFFQANLDILPKVIDKLEALMPGDAGAVFLDLYAGVGLFGLCLADRFQKVVMIEENPASARIARHNLSLLDIGHAEMMEGRVEDVLPGVLDQVSHRSPVAMIDPPRKGLSEPALQTVADARHLRYLFYLSCHPESLARDLKDFRERGWRVHRVVPFDFFPRTRHLETLVLLENDAFRERG